MRLKLILLSFLSALLLGACGAQPASAPAAATDEDEAKPAAPAATQEPQEPAPAPSTGGSLRVALPAEGTIGFDGFGPARFGATEEEVRMAWGGDLGDASPGEPGGCHYLMPQPVPAQGYRVAFMIEGDRFVRIDVASDEITAPGGGKVGMGVDELQERYHGALQSTPHKYVEGGQYLSVDGGEGAPGKLVFEVDDSGKATRWRIGVPPQVDYVEGCS